MDGNSDHIQLTDDIDGRPADESIRFRLDTDSFEIDLTSENATRLRDVLAVYVAHSRKVREESTRPLTANAAPAPKFKDDLAAIRE